MNEKPFLPSDLLSKLFTDSLAELISKERLSTQEFE
jgi:hypothetical protein